MEHKTCKAIVLKADEAEGIVECIFSVFGVLDFGNDIVHSGAFTKTWNERGHKIRLLDSHDTKSVLSALGKPLEFRELKRAELPQALMDEYPEATGGAWAKVQFNMKTDAGRDAFWHVANGDVDEWSYGYDAVDKDHTKINYRGQDVIARNLRQIKQYELSPVIFGMLEATTTTDAKAKPTEGKPYRAIHEGDTWNVYKLDGEGKPAGKPLGRHPSEDEAEAQISALYANEDDDKSAKAKWTAAYINDLPDSSFLHIESGGEKDEDGKTTPRSLRHLPYKDAEGNVDLPHLRNAISRLGQTDTGTTGGESWLSEDVRKRLLSRARGILEDANKNNDDPTETKAGRVLSARNAKRIKAAMDELHSCLMEAGLMEMPDENEEASKVFNITLNVSHDKAPDVLREFQLLKALADANTGPQKSDTDTPTPKAQGAGPNEDDSTRLLKLIDLELEETEV